MARYLTPAKIGLLALIELYTEEAVPSDAVLPVLSFVTSHVLERSHMASAPMRRDTQWRKTKETVSLVVSIKDFENLLGAYPLLMGMPGRRLWDQFLTKMWDINSLDALNCFFEALPALLSKTKEERRRLGDDHPQSLKLSRNSPFGAFVRRARLEFQRLRFHDGIELWKDLVRYRRPTAQYMKRKNPTFGPLSFDSVLLEGEKDDWGPDGVAALATVAYGENLLAGDESGTVPVSTDDIEVMLEFQIEQMQKFGNRVPPEMHEQFRNLLRDSFTVPSLSHYFSYLDAWKAGDYTTAFDFLHRYFDYTMQYRDRLYYQYALMNLAVLQADFGCHQEAISAMLETVSTARENRDMTCLNFALNWLFHYTHTRPGQVRDLESSSLLGTGKETLAFLRVKAKESGMWTLWSSVLLSEAKVGLINGDSMATTFETLVRSSQVIVERNLQSMLGSQLGLCAALWTRLGLAYASESASETFLRCHAHNSAFEDELKHTCHIALTLTEQGKYDEGIERLDGFDGDSRCYWKLSKHWQIYRGILKLKRDLHHNNLEGAGQLLAQLLQSRQSEMEPDMASIVDSLHIDYLSRRGDLQAAFAELTRLMGQLQDEKRDIVLRLRLLLLKVTLLSKCGRPQRAFSTAVRAANMAWRARLMPCLWQAMGALANTLVSRAEFAAAAEILTAVLPRAYECAAAAPIAQLYSVLADAHMGLAGAAAPRSSQRTESLARALRAVQKAFDHFSAVEDVERQCEMMAKKALVMRLTGENALAADYAAAYVELRKNADRLSLGQS